MKLALRLLSVVAVLSFATSSLAAPKMAGSKHDLTTGSHAIGGLTEICKVCHVPHKGVKADGSLGDGSGGQQPLWNHQYPDGTGYTFYTTIKGNTVNINGTSKACLGCHDGVIAIENYGGATSGTDKLTSSDSAYVGNDLTDDHPIGIDYPTSDDGYFGTLPTTDVMQNHCRIMTKVEFEKLKNG